MRSSTSGSSPGWVWALALLFAALPPVAAWVTLPAAREGSALPVIQRTRLLPVPDPTQVVLLGNSKAGTDIDVAALASAAGRPDLRLKVLSIGSATLPVYYAVVKNVVFAQAKPTTIIVYASRVEILASDLTTDRRQTLLVPFMTSNEPVIARKLYAHSANGWEGLRERAVAARDGTLSLVAEEAAAAVSVEPGRTALDAAFNDVFGQTWATRELPNVAGVQAGAYPSQSALPQVLEDSFVLELEELVHAHGARLVFAVAPVSGIIREREDTRLRGLGPVLRQAAAHADAWIDLPQPSEDPSNWRDGEHLNPGAAKALSTTLGAELAARGMLP